MTVRVWSPAVGVRVRLKVENASDTTITCETDAITTKSGQWETLTFDFANPGLSPPVSGGPTSPLDLSKTYNRLSIFMDFGLGNGGSGPLPADRFYYVDDITFVSGGGGGGGATAPTDAPTTVIPAGSITIYSEAAATAGFNPFPNWGQATQCVDEQTIAGNKSLKYTNLNYEGIDWSPPGRRLGQGQDALRLLVARPDQREGVDHLGRQGERLHPGPDHGELEQRRHRPEQLHGAGQDGRSIQIKLESTTPGTLYVDNIYFGGTAGGGGGGWRHGDRPTHRRR